MPFVLDASTTITWGLADEYHPHAESALILITWDQALVPSLWWFEVRNILIINERRKRISAIEIATFLHKLSNMSITQDLAPQEMDILRIARQHRLTVYDASYLELAKRKNAALATLDTELIRAANAEGVPVIGENP
jgi:predicted nucleic acid-binding protein